MSVLSVRPRWGPLVGATLGELRGRESSCSTSAGSDLLLRPQRGWSEDGLLDGAPEAAQSNTYELRRGAGLRLHCFVPI